MVGEVGNSKNTFSFAIFEHFRLVYNISCKIDLKLIYLFNFQRILCDWFTRYLPRCFRSKKTSRPFQLFVGIIPRFLNFLSQFLNQLYDVVEKSTTPFRQVKSKYFFKRNTIFCHFILFD